MSSQRKEWMLAAANFGTHAITLHNHLSWVPPPPRYPSQELTWHPSKYVFLWTVKWEREREREKDKSWQLILSSMGILGWKTLRERTNSPNSITPSCLTSNRSNTCRSRRAAPCHRQKNHIKWQENHLKNITRVALQSILHSKGTAGGTQLIQTSYRWWSCLWHQQKVTLTQVYTNIYWNDSAHPVCKQVLLLVFE